MDKSGDGHISNCEVITGFKKLGFKEKEDAALDKITENISSNSELLIKFKDFLLCSIDLGKE